MRRLVFACALLVSSTPGRVFLHAETYRNIRPLSTLGELKQQFPGAKFERLHPAWAQEDDVLFGVTGEGLPGTIIIKFSDDRPAFRALITKAKTDAIRAKYQRMLDAMTDDNVTVDWVRWVPDEPFPVRRVIAKYGTAFKKGFADSDLQPYLEWTIGVTAFLSDDESKVVRIDYSFTRSELRAAWQLRYGFAPDELKDPPAAKKRVPR